jgi:hypothetical protein
MSTTQIYVHLAGVVFRDEAEWLEQRLLGAPESTPGSSRNSTVLQPSDSFRGFGGLSVPNVVPT